MYVCGDCGNAFEEPKRIEERHGFDYGPYEEWHVCPYCESTYFLEMPTCKICGDYINSTYYETDDGKYCPECVYKGNIFDDTIQN